MITLYYTKNQLDAALAVLFISHCKITLHVSDAYCGLCILIVRPRILKVVYVFLTLSMYSYCGLRILIVRPRILKVVYVFLTLSMYSYCGLCILIVRPCILIVVYVYLLLSTYS